MLRVIKVHATSVSSKPSSFRIVPKQVESLNGSHIMSLKLADLTKNVLDATFA